MPAQAGRRKISALLWTASYGSCAQGLPGGIFLRGLAHGKPSTSGSVVGLETVYGRQVFERLKASRQAGGGIDWHLFMIDATIVRAHKAAAGAEKKSAVGRAR